MKTDYIKLEKTFNRVLSAMKSVADVDTINDLNQLSYAVAEIRHAAVMLDSGEQILDVEERLIKNLFLQN